jgi:hypothetical protein
MREGQQRHSKGALRRHLGRATGALLLAAGLWLVPATAVPAAADVIVEELGSFNSGAQCNLGLAGAHAVAALFGINHSFYCVNTGGGWRLYEVYVHEVVVVNIS